MAKEPENGTKNLKSILKAHGPQEKFKIAALALTWLTILALFIGLCVKYGQFKHSNQDQCTRNNNIGFEGNEDFYGLGIRLGSYLQWLASLIATGLYERERRLLTRAYLGAQIAMLAAFLALMFRDTCVFTTEAIVVLYFLLGGLSSVLGPDLVSGLIGGRYPKLLRKLDFAIMFLVCLIATIASWFWIRLAIVGDGVDFMSTPGGMSMFLFARVHSSGLPLASAYMAIICLYLAICTAEKGVWLVITKMNQKHLVWEPPSFIIAKSARGLDILARKLGSLIPGFLIPSFLNEWSNSFSTWNQQGLDRIEEDIEAMPVDENSLPTAQQAGTSHRSGRTSKLESLHDALLDRGSIDSHRYIYGFAVRIVSFPLSLICMSLSIVAIELTLAWNHVTRVYTVSTAGQIIPLTVGVTLVLSVLWTTWDRVIKGNTRRRQGRDQNAPSPNAGDAKDKQLPLTKRISYAFTQPSGPWRGPRYGRGARIAPPELQNPPSELQQPPSELQQRPPYPREGVESAPPELQKPPSGVDMPTASRNPPKRAQTFPRYSEFASSGVIPSLCDTRA